MGLVTNRPTRGYVLTSDSTSIFRKSDVDLLLHLLADKLAQGFAKTGVEVGVMFDETGGSKPSAAARVLRR